MEKTAGSLESNLGDTSSVSKYNSRIPQLLAVLPLQPIPIEDIEPHLRYQGIHSNKKLLKARSFPFVTNFDGIS
jgi:hypothetical protein